MQCSFIRVGKYSINLSSINYIEHGEGLVNIFFSGVDGRDIIQLYGEDLREFNSFLASVASPAQLGS